MNYVKRTMDINFVCGPETILYQRIDIFEFQICFNYSIELLIYTEIWNSRSQNSMKFLIYTELRKNSLTQCIKSVIWNIFIP